MKDKGSISVESGIIIPLIIVIISFFIIFFVNVTYITVRSVKDSYSSSTATDRIDDTDIDRLINTFFDFLEGVKE